ncbi:general odorant-binding protein 99a-like [Episyrphus balteatus]|uniref:general odorant-binding protein 99a-like n=1 Tax=Episyrphus balteatus TaxID=286459 RepID=UPI0024850EB3|nr:general odorant-binding protein 99a-like [Episyrphus balteatus]
MKIYIILAIIAISSAAEWKYPSDEEIKSFHASCLKSFEEKRINKDTEMTSKERFEVYLCLARKIGIWSDSEGFSVDKMMIDLDKVATEARQHYDKQLLRQSIESCVDKNSEGSTPFEWAKRCFQCFLNNQTFLKFISGQKETVEDYSLDD